MPEEGQVREVQRDDIEIDLGELLSYLWENKKKIFIAVITGTLISLLIALLTPRKYISRVALYPISEKGTTALALSPELLQLVGITQPSPLLPVAESLYLRQKVVKKLGLERELLGPRADKVKAPLIEAAEKLKDRVKVREETRKGIIRLEVEWEDPKRAYEVASCYVETLREIMNEKAFTWGKMQRLFYEQELEKTEQQLLTAQQRLNELQEAKRVILPDKDLEAKLSLYSSLLKEKLTLESKLRGLLAVYTAEHPLVKGTRESLGLVSKKLNELESSMYNALGAIPEYSVAFAEVQRLKSRYEGLARLYEAARLQELREGLYFEVVDPPVVPSRPEKPKRKLILALGFVLSVFLATLGLLVKKTFGRSERETTDQIS